ncbi:hypothetical protein Scep_016132 [Stephania cephalantha]|uniref:Xyloglucan endotransglucosylase/hydrolase n=1 Tax=Stephania cephalantha TaxID=152367 RepID=A0AAP0IM13_9MAGN
MLFSAYCAMFVTPLQSASLPTLSFDEAYSHLFGDSNLSILNDGKSVTISLDRRTGSGFVSQDLYLYGFFSSSIKLPSDYTAGVVVAFYMSNGDVFEKNHDELDFEFLGNIRGKEWRVQTNVYGNGSTSVGREERFKLWFDPTEDFHEYSILWTNNLIVFYVDDVPIREVRKTKIMGGDFPSKPMSLYATIWDASNWATNGGKYRVNYKYAPYVAEFSDFVLRGCPVNPIEQATPPKCDQALLQSLTTGALANKLNSNGRSKMAKYREKYMTYSYCYDRQRYNSLPSECAFSTREAVQLKRFNPVTFNAKHYRHGKQYFRKRENRIKSVHPID